MRNVTLAATQMKCTTDPEYNVSNAEKLIRQAKDKGADVVLIQELFAHQYFCQVYNYDYFNLAKDEQGHPVIQRMMAVAKELHVVIPVSFFEKAGNTHYNSVVMIDADGRNLGKYRKTHIPDDPGYYEKFYFTPGDTGFKVWKTRFGSIGVGICWDQWFPEAARCMCLQGAEILMYPTAIGTFAAKPEKLAKETFNNVHWQNTMLGHSAANVVPVVASNRIGTEYIDETGITFYGSSFISDQYGNILEAADTKTESILVRTFDLDELANDRRMNVFFRDRRPERYQTLMTIDGITPAY